MSAIQYIVDVTAEDTYGYINVIGHLGPYDTELAADKAANYLVAMTADLLTSRHGFVPAPIFFRDGYVGTPVHECLRFTLIDGVRDESSKKEIW